MRTIAAKRAFLVVALMFLAPAVSAKDCDGGGMLSDYLAGKTEGPRPNEIADVWIGKAVPDDVESDSLAALREAIVAFEGPRPSPREAAEIVAGEWTGWRAKQMSREDFVSEFLAEVEERRAVHGEYGAILQAAQATRNHLDDLYGAAGGRNPPEDPSMMWLWDITMRKPLAAAEVSRLQNLTDGKWLWGRYTMNRKTAIACALDAMATPAVVFRVNRKLFKQPDTIVPLAEAKSVELDDRTMAYLSGLLEVHLPACPWLGTPDELEVVTRFFYATTNRALTDMFDMRNIVIDSVEFAMSANDGNADAEAFEAEYGCASPANRQLSRGLVRTVRVAHTAASESLFVFTCSSTSLTAKQCICLAEAGRGIYPNIERMAYDRRTTIKTMIEKNPLIAVQILACGVVNY